jgi:hypothetical protein
MILVGAFRRCPLVIRTALKVVAHSNALDNQDFVFIKDYPAFGFRFESASASVDSARLQRAA